MSFALGMPTLIELPDLAANVDVCRRLGLAFVELNMNLPAFCPENLDPMDIKRVSAESGVGFTVHLPEELDLASFHPPIREGHIRRCEQAIDWAGRAGAALVNMHLNPGVYFTLPDGKAWIYDRHSDRFLSLLSEAISRLLDLAAVNGVMLAIENTGCFDLQFMANAIDRLSALDGFCLTWDLGHDAESGYNDRDTITRHIDKVRHFHLHDSDGKSSHQVLMTGIVDVSGTLDLARRIGAGVVIETKTVDALSVSVEAIRGLTSAHPQVCP